MIFSKNKPRVLAIGAHPDDIELGAGGLIWRLVQERRAEVDFLIITPGLNAQEPGSLYAAGTRQKEAEVAGKQLGAKDVKVLNYPDCGLHLWSHQIIRSIEQELYAKDRSEKYDLVLSHAKADTHQDHRMVYDATASAARYFRGTILMYQAPSTILHEFKQTVFVNLNDDAKREKDAAIQRHISQRDKEFMWWRHTVLTAKAIGEAQRWTNTDVEGFELFRTLWEESSVKPNTKTLQRAKSRRARR